MRISAEMAEDIGIIPYIHPYKTYKKFLWSMDRLKTNEEIIQEKRERWAPFGYDEKTHTVEIDHDG